MLRTGTCNLTGALKGAKLCLGSVLTPSFQGGDLEHKSVIFVYPLAPYFLVYAKELTLLT